jgi:hypothetical protein
MAVKINGTWMQTIAELLSFTSRKSEEADVIDQVVSVAKGVAVTLLPANENRVGTAFSNNGAVDVVIRLKAAATDNNIEGIILKTGESKVLNPLTYKGEISSIRLTTTGTQTADILVNEW